MQYNNDTYSLQLLQCLLDGPYLPFTNSALRPLCMAHILNDIVLNSRKKILEFGSGLSTIMMGRMIKRNGTGSRLISIEHNRDWVNVVQTFLQNEGMDDAVSIVYAPLSPSGLSIDSNLWYGLDADTGDIAGSVFDMVVIDGPPAYEAAKKMARYPALPFIYPKLSERFSVFLDDAGREGEKAIIRQWEEKYSVRFIIVDDSFAYYCRGDNFNVNIF